MRGEETVGETTIVGSSLVNTQSTTASTATPPNLAANPGPSGTAPAPSSANRAITASAVAPTRMANTTLGDIITNDPQSLLSKFQQLPTFNPVRDNIIVFLKRFESTSFCNQ